MSRVLIAWELGSGYGHLPSMALMAERLRAGGHAVCAAAPGQTPARAALGAEVLEVYAAPTLRERPEQRNAIAWNDVVARAHMDDPAEVARLVDAWRSLCIEARVDVVLADHAPMALLAARSLGLTAGALGTGFVCPPDGRALPALRDADEETLLACRTRERALLDTWNDVLQGHGASPLESVGALSNSTPPWLLTWPALDPYAEHRAGDMHLGAPPEPRPASPLVALPAWPEQGVGRLFAYLRADWVALPALADALADSGHACVLHVPGASPALRDRLSAANVAVAADPVDMDGDLGTCDVVVGHAGHALTSAALLAGCPMLLLPSHLEQSLTAHSVTAMGAGIALDSGAGRSDFASAIEQLLSEERFIDRACAFAETHVKVDVAAIDERLEALLPA